MAGGVIADAIQSYIFLPKQKAFVYAEFSDGDSLVIVPDPDYSIKELASSGIKSSKWFVSEYKGKKGGEALFSISSEFYRGDINPDESYVSRKGMERYLGEDDDVNTLHESVTDVAQEIRNQLPEAHKDNPYALTEGVIDWIRGNIEYIAVPRRIINHVKETVGWLSGEERTDAYKILKYSFGLNEEVLEKVAGNIQLSAYWRESSNYEIAKELMTKANNIWKGFQFFWLDEECSAQKTLEEKAGKCVGISNLFVALSRNLGIPSRTVSGYIGDRYFGGAHTWTVSDIQPYGWVEADPTMHRFTDFRYDAYAYRFSINNDNLPKLTVIEESCNVSGEEFESAIRLLEEDRNWLDRLFGRIKHRYEIDFLSSLKEQSESEL